MYDQPVRLVHPITSSSSSYCSSQVQGQTLSAFFYRGSPLTTNPAPPVPHQVPQIHNHSFSFYYFSLFSHSIRILLFFYSFHIAHIHYLSLNSLPVSCFLRGLNSLWSLQMQILSIMFLLGECGSNTIHRNRSYCTSNQF